jgi:hypothetical protein
MDDHAAKGRFRGAYSMGNALDGRAHSLTSERDTIEEVVADLLEAQQQRGALHFAQILDTTTLRPIEPAQRTLARLSQPEAGREGTPVAKQPSLRPNSGDRETSARHHSFGLLLLAMAVICIATVACVLMLP